MPAWLRLGAKPHFWLHGTARLAPRSCAERSSIFGFSAQRQHTMWSSAATGTRGSLRKAEAHATSPCRRRYLPTSYGLKGVHPASDYPYRRAGRDRLPGAPGPPRCRQATRRLGGWLCLMLPPPESLWYQMRSHPRHGEPSYRGHLGGETACYAWRTYIRASASSTSLMRGRRCSGRGRTLSWRSLARALIYKVCVHGPAAYDSAYSVVMCPGQNCCWRTHERTCSVSRAHRRTSGSSRSRRYRRASLSWWLTEAHFPARWTEL